MPAGVKEKDVEAGDVIYRHVKGGSSKHYGIYIGNGDVIHLKKEGILWERLDVFSSNCEVYGTK